MGVGQHCLKGGEVRKGWRPHFESEGIRMSIRPNEVKEFAS